jgi:hypothetical protein
LIFDIFEYLSFTFSFSGCRLQGKACNLPALAGLLGFSTVLRSFFCLLFPFPVFQKTKEKKKREGEE